MKALDFAVACCVTILAAMPAIADEGFVGKSVVTSAFGAPFCTDRDQLQEYMMALVQKDEKWLASLDTCLFLKGGIKVAVIEDYPGSDLGHVVKGRVFGPNGSIVAYTLSLGLSEAK